MALTEYSKEKIHISIDSKLLKKLEKIKTYPRWRGNRSAIIEQALHNFLEDEEVK